jgi:hypothetical protein
MRAIDPGVSADTRPGGTRLGLRCNFPTKTFKRIPKELAAFKTFEYRTTETFFQKMES